MSMVKSYHPPTPAPSQRPTAQPSKLVSRSTRQHVQNPFCISAPRPSLSLASWQEARKLDSARPPVLSSGIWGFPLPLQTPPWRGPRLYPQESSGPSRNKWMFWLRGRVWSGFQKLPQERPGQVVGEAAICTRHLEAGPLGRRTPDLPGVGDIATWEPQTLAASIQLRESF